MKLEEARLLIVLERADYRARLKQTLLNSAASDPAMSEKPPRKELPRTLPIVPFDPELSKPTEQVNERLSAVDLHVLEAVDYWRSHLQEVAIFSLYSTEPYSEVTSSGIRLMGSGLSSAAATNDDQKREIVRLIADYCPTHIVVCTPSSTVLSWANRNQIPSVVLLRNWQEPLGWWQRWQHRNLIGQLNHNNVAWVGSHGAYACEILKASGISDRKLIPWGWPQPELFKQHAAKQLRYRPDATELVYVGSMHSKAGVGELLLAVSHLQQRGKSVHLSLVCQTFQKKQQATKRPTRAASKSKAKTDEILGHPSSLAAYSSTTTPASAGHPDDILGKQPLANEGPQHGDSSSKIDPDLIQLDADLSQNLAQLRSQIEQLNLSQHVTVVPALPEAALIAKIRAADLLVIPNFDRDWPTAVPPSLYLAMAARTPVIAADCPQFSQHLLHGVNAMIFPVGNAKSMAHRIERVMDQPQLYKQLSEALEVAITTLNVPAQWAEVIDYWLNSAPHIPAGADNHQRLCNWAFSSGRYQTAPLARQQPSRQQLPPRPPNQQTSAEQPASPQPPARPSSEARNFQAVNSSY